MNKLLRTTGAIVGMTVCLGFAQPSYASESSVDDWYMHIDVKAMRNSEMLSDIEEDKQKGIAIMNELIGPALTDKIAYLSMRGDLNDGGAKVLLAQGDFDSATDQAEIKAKIIEVGFNPSETSGVYKLDNEAFHVYLETAFNNLQEKGLIDADDNAELTIGDNTEEKDNVYLGFQSTNTLVISSDLGSITQLISAKKQWDPTANSGVFEVVVDIEKALMHGGVNINSEDQSFEFESISAKELKQFSATYSEDNGYVELQVGLRTTNDETASQVEAIARGLIALQSMSLSDPALKSMINNAVFLRSGNDISFTIQGSVDDFKSLKSNVGM